MTKRNQRRRPSRKTKEDVFDALRSRISKHELLPGSKLREFDLVAEFGISRGHVRDILAGLEQRGLVVRIPNRGAMVAFLDAEQAINLYFVREGLEEIAARLAAERAPAGTWNRLIKKLGPSIEAKMEKGDYEEYEQILDELNRLISKCANNPILADILDRLYDRTQVISRKIIVLQGRAKTGLDLHRRLLQALSAKKSAESGDLKAEIISTARECIDRYRQFMF